MTAAHPAQSARGAAGRVLPQWLLLAVLALCGVSYLIYAARALSYPFGLDYAEGEVWQQAVMIPGPLMYGDINHYPFIGFEYPPAYHLLVNAVVACGSPFLLAGRSVSLLATLVSALCVARLATVGWATGGRATAGRANGAVAPWLAALAAGLLLFTLRPVIEFSTLVRVDMLAVAASLGGMVLAIAALRRPALLYGAMLAFLLALFTKQTSLAAPVAAGLVMLARAPRLALRAGGAAALLGGGLFALLCWWTDGGFFRHVILYNVNRFSFLHFIYFALYALGPYFLLVGLALYAAGGRVLALARQLPGARALEALRADDRVAIELMLSLYVLLAGASCIMAGKAGSSLNYFIEFMCLCCVWVGRAMAARGGGTPWIAMLLSLQCAYVPIYLAQAGAAQFGPAARQRDAALLAAVRALPGPVLSDDLALLKLAGKEVPIEPYIFAELGTAGFWREQALVDMLNRQEFSAVVTFKDPGNIVFDDRFLPRTVAAMQLHYPQVVNFGDVRLRLPAGAAP